MRVTFFFFIFWSCFSLNLKGTSGLRIYVPWSKLVVLGMGKIPPLIGILIMGPYKPLRTWVDEFIPYYMEIIWSNYSDLTRPHSKWWFSKGNPLISGKSRLVKYYNLARRFIGFIGIPDPKNAKNTSWC